MGAVRGEGEGEMRTVQGELLEYLKYLKESGVGVVEGEKSAKGAVAVQQAAVGAAQAAAVQTAAETPQKRTQQVASLPGMQQGAELPPMGTSTTLEGIAEEIASCRRCGLCETRTKTVPGQGNGESPLVMFVGEGPGADEDAQGLAFVGRAGKLLTQMIAAMGFRREELFIGNIVKCRPPGNRVPTPEEMAGCIPYLKRQIAIVKPHLLVCLGATAARGLVGETKGITRVRGQWREFEGIPVMLTFHPAFLLRDPSRKREAWEDLKAVLARLGRTPPGRGKPSGEG